ncbi:hypothetical protein N7448_003248 [Penicillium atrosanguineum]|uniref:Uncharacterized protein n=1 Tax=Penicillium atrosanguineum TaxID=1132637 RepID=A0A9W9PVY7_9EURO|nr:uncharacterized protein N7443_002220 [Penicillium atrosanguineum]KAJ5122117.1 hypothetical protein N7526_009054 [Penicillium atrosanguineum]KAJ5139840.1 hypothetical protein N7448_003248 [Penicillium atrosanguineum]KAJ5309759.1 hypothetical protein N7443_002220 [Penicillium atrosanguineum]KAJ5315280.1 hypothetical protein N7476_005587 [Penicillium atrosanguineum]
MGARSRQGCFSCRRRKKKCDEVKPICTACLRNSLGCTWPEFSFSPHEASVEVGSTRQKTRARSQYGPKSDTWALALTNAPSKLLTLTIPAAPSNFALPGVVSSGSGTWRLLDHYLKDTANRLACLQDSQNPFLHTILPAALNDELLMNAILALSGVHLMQRVPQLDLNVQSLASSSYTRALKQLRVALSDLTRNGSSVDGAWRALIIVLIFYLLEATRGSDPKAMQGHLDGAHHLMAYVMRFPLTSTPLSIVSFTTDLYVYNAGLASFTTNCSPISTSQSETWANTSASTVNPVGVMCGCAHDLFIFVPRVSSLLWDITSETSSEAGHRESLIDDYHALRTQIVAWKPSSDQEDLVLCAELYRQSLLLLLDSRFARKSTSSIADQAFRNLEFFISRLPPQSPIATTATWPFFAFGIHAQNPQQKEVVRSYLKSLITTFGMGVMSTALNQLEEIWMLEPSQDVVNRFFTHQNQLFLIC